MTRRAPVEVVIARNGTLGPLHLAIPIGPGRWAAACTQGGKRRMLAGDRVKVWTQDTGGDVWGEVRTCTDCLYLGDEARDTLHLAELAGWSRPSTWGQAPTAAATSRRRH